MANNRIGPSVAIDGEAEYRKSMEAIIQQQKTLNAQMKTATEVFKSDNDAKKKNKAQTELLTKEIKNQETILEDLKKQYNDSVVQSGEFSKESEKLATKIANAELAMQKMNNQLDSIKSGGFSETLQNIGEKFQEVGDKVSKVGDSMTKGITAPITAVGTASVAAFKSVDEATDTIIQKTGASGEALDGMVESMENIATTIPSSFGDVADSIGEVNTRFGLTGDALEDVSSQFIKFANLNGTSVSSSIDSVQKSMSAFNVRTEDTSKVLDTLNKVGQDTGISVDTLSSLITTNATALKGLNLNYAESANLLGALEKSGIDTSAVMMGLSRVQKTAMQDGISMEAALSTALSSSGDALDIFGSKAGPKLYEAFQQGILSVDMFTSGTASLNDAVGNVSNTFDATLDPIDKWQTALNEVKIAGAELGGQLFEVLAPIISKVSEAVKGFSEWFKGLNDEQQNAIVKIALVVAALGPMLSIFGKVTSGVNAAIGAFTTISGVFSSLSGVSGILGTAIAALTSPIGIAVAAIAAAIAIGVELYKNWDTIKEKASQLASSISTKFNEIKDSITGKINAAKDAVRTAIEKIKGFFNFSWSLPHLKMPHLSITGGFSLVPPRVPRFGVQWYGKGYEGLEFKKPTVIPTMDGLKGFGERAGSEMLIGKNNLMHMISQASRGNGMVLNITVNPSPGMDETDLAEKVADIIQHQIDVNGGAFV